MKNIAKRFTILMLLSTIIFTNGCASRLDLNKRKRKADDIAAISNMQEHIIPAGLFNLTTWQRVREAGETIHIYIEGDGLAWLSKYKVSNNPTPPEPLTLELATRDRNPNVIYIARPCQYSGWNKHGHCSSLFWTHGRTAPEVIKSFQIALDQIKIKYTAKDFVLTGYSGGGAVAAILAGTRDDVVALRTVAGNLDYKTFTNHHKVSPMHASQEPINFAYDTRTIPQLHFIGGRDKIIPEIIFNKWASVANNPSCVKKLVLPNVSHDKGWVDEWNRLQQMQPACY